MTIRENTDAQRKTQQIAAERTPPLAAANGDCFTDSLAIYSAFVCDLVGNCSSYSEQDLIDLGFPTVLQVLSTPDTTAPAIADFSFSPGTIDVSGGPQNVTVSEHLTENLAGVAYSCFGFLSPSGLQNHGSCNSSPYQRDSGDNLDGMYHVDVTFPQYGELGLWHVYYAFVCDVIGNCRNYSEQELIALGSPTILEVTASRDITLFLHGSGGTANPPSLLLNDVSPISATAKYKDSTSINFSGGNAWKTVGSWGAASSLTGGSLTALTELRAWLGLKNSDDQGTNFDLRAEVYKNNTLVGSGETYCVQNVTRNPSYAVEVTVDLAPFSPVDFNGTSDVLTLKVLTRIGTNGAGTSCGGHGNAVGLRLYFDAASRASKFGGTF